MCQSVNVRTCRTGMEKQSRTKLNGRPAKGPEFAKKTNAGPKYRRGTSTKRQLISSEQKKCGINQQMGVQFRQACREKPEAQKI
ncbi:hypothetical protein FOB63_001379 [Clavispora lusitaniae]|uniref:uncharacterized protein n=1 Tax=Clavispora lusitaniae TaxID=36911 RepID=UPI00202C8D2D|nr:hypothetical protein FOB63_001379 [Clavispora lusitaniae]